MNIQRQSKWKNYGLWLSIASLVGLIFKDYIPSNYQDIVTIILSILVALGVISNPSKGKMYGDN